MKYTLKGLTTQQAIKQYVLNAMTEMKLGQEEIQEYTRQIKRYDFSYLQQVSQEYIDMLNSLEEERKNPTCKVYYVEGLI